MIQDLDILSALAKLLKENIDSGSYEPVDVYLNNINEGFNTPCFFIECMTTSKAEHKNRILKHSNIFITYIPKTRMDGARTYKECNIVKKFYQVGNQISALLAHGLEVKTKTDRRYLKINSIAQSTKGDGPDFLALDFTTSYYDYIQLAQEEAPVMDKLNYELKEKGNNE